MSESTEALSSTKPTDAPLVFISHDTRDSELAEAFSKLLKSVSAGMLKSFRSSDKKGNEGIVFGDEWYKTLMSNLSDATNVVCLLTERSFNRPWLLYEAGVAKGKFDKSVHGLALGIKLDNLNVGPFYQFQNCDGNDEDSLVKLVRELCDRVPGLTPDEDIVKAQVVAFRTKTDDVLKTLGGSKKPEKKEPSDDGVAAKIMEEMKFLLREFSMRFNEQLPEGSERLRQRRVRRFHPMLVEEMVHRGSRHPGDPIGILIIASFVRDDFPWLYEIGVEAYQAVKLGKQPVAHEALSTFRDVVARTVRGPIMEEMGLFGKEARMLLYELPRLIDHQIHLVFEKPTRKRSHLGKLLKEE